MLHGPAGRLCPNADLGDGRRLDEATVGRFAVITTASVPSDLVAEARRRDGIVLTVQRNSELGQWLRRQRTSAAVVRPDGTVLHAGRDLAAACSTLPSSGRNPVAG